MRFRFLSWCAACALAAPVVAHAQATGADAVYARARQLVASGDGAAGRQLVDSMLAAAPPQSGAYAEALYWRGVLAPTTVEAEPDYRRIVVEYPLSARAADALLKLGEIEISRGDRAGARAHLERFLLENPSRPDRGRAGFLLARALFEQDDQAHACAVLERTLGDVPQDSAELRNQFEFYAPRCDGVDTSAASPRKAERAAVAPKRETPRAETPKREPARKAPTRTRDDVSAGASETGAVIAPHSLPDRSAPVAVESKAQDTAAAAPTPAAEPAPKTRAKSAAKPRATGRFTLQVAAYGARGGAQALVAKLAKRDIDARVVGESKPFRVRVGRYATRADAVRAAKALEARGIKVFVTQTGADDR